VGQEGHSFEAVEAVVANPFPPGIDPDLIRLPAVARLRSPEDTGENHLRYWQAHLWETLLRYRRAYRDPACTDRLRAGYFEVDQAAVRLAERATSGFPLSPIDSVGCHSMLKELHAGALGLEAPSQGPRRREGIDEPVRRIDLEHLARLLAVPGHVEGELVANHRSHLTVGPPESHQLGFGQ